MLQEEVLDYWSRFQSERSVEEPSIARTIEPLFNRLTVFDPRIPHAVGRVEGTHDPREGRLVIQGWFVQPRPFIEGPLHAPSLSSAVARVSDALALFFERGLPVAGMLNVGFVVAKNGRAAAVRVLSDTARVPEAWEQERQRLVRAVRSAIKGHTFARATRSSRVTLPLVFSQEG